MNKITIIVFTTLVMATSYAEYTVKFHLQSSDGGALPNGSININPIDKSEEWGLISPTYTLWENSGDIYDCDNWLPDQNTVTIGQPFIQSTDDCKQNQIRLRQNREQESSTLIIRDIGSPITESQVISSSNTRESIGSLENWILANPTYTEWTIDGEPFNCTNWTPSKETVAVAQTFTQTATNCEQNQIRTRQNIEQETTTLVYRNAGSPIIENQKLTGISNTRQEIGTKEDIVGCYTSDGSNFSYWNELSSFLTSQNIAFMNEKIWPEGDSYVEFAPIFTSYMANGYRYTRGDLVKTTVTTDYGVTVTTKEYKVCRVKI